VIARVGYFADFDLTDRQYVLEAIRLVPGFRGVYHLADETTGDALSVSLWESEESARAGEQAVGEARRAGGHGGPGPVRTQTFQVVRSIAETGV
jgi:heme-degrading monooxygenase HmoA